ncbi:hypothetical protein [Fischerella sp. PCC 9605]|uniref:hypothetical protein n=1 Tax=Fischerella sp. PCC 9605 TaxID=1173024 RepID=UPI0004BB6DD3|nr:hypothetical protein [Fischerella sp. PCC 9605]
MTYIQLTSVGKPTERNQAQLMDNYAEYDRNKTRGIPRPGAALLQWDSLLW